MGTAAHEFFEGTDMEKELLKTSQKEAFPPIVSGFGFSPLPQALWRTDARSQLSCRDLSLDQASADVLRSRHLRAAGASIRTDALGDPEAAFAFIFVLAGKVSFQPADGAAVTLAALDSVCRYGAGHKTSWTLSHDAEVVEIVAGPAAAPSLGLPAATPRQWHVNLEDEDLYSMGEGPRKYFRYRDLGVAATTGRRIHIHVVRSTKAIEGGTGWHWHTMGQLFYVLRGWAEITVEHQPWVKMSAGDAMCVAPRMAHNVPAFSQDYLVLEMCIPADYDTVDSQPA